MPPQSSPQTTPSNSHSRRNPRLRLACSRCQKRKIRCDGDYPTCRNCRKASATCVDGESLRLRNVASLREAEGASQQVDNETFLLKERIASLEAIIRSHLPNVDLSQDLSRISPETTLLGPTDNSGSAGNATSHLGVSDDLSRTGPEGAAIVSAPTASNDALSHEIGLVSVGSTSDPRYIGPSSGYFLARMLLTSRPRQPFMHQDNRNGTWSNSSQLLGELVETMQGPLPLPRQEQAEKVCQVYFDVVHMQFPILHTQLFMDDLRRLYSTPTPEPLAAFQVYMVLAIGSTIMSHRSKVRVPAESYCLSALQFFDNLNVENSVPGLQCLLLLMIFTIHSPQMRLNIWYLNYHAIAAVVDLGLQRNITTTSGVSLLEQEMRTRLFWVVFMFDRTIATMMGRPIGLRDEACELRLPQNLDDFTLLAADPTGPQAGQGISSHMRWSINLFKLAKINSEIKYVANSIVRDTPTGPGYADPAISSINEWQADALQRLDQLANEIPTAGDSEDHIRLTCQIHYHSLRMLLLRPSPAIPKPSTDCLKACYESAGLSIRMYDEMYKRDLLVYSWMTFHGLILSIITMIYCVRAVPDIVSSINIETLMSDFSTGLSILSATGEHWPGAKRSRDILHDLSRATVRWIKDTHTGSATARAGPSNATASAPFVTHPSLQESPMTANANEQFGMDSTHPISMDGTYPATVEIPLFDGAWDFPFGGSFDTVDFANDDQIIRSLFEDLISQPM